MQKIIVVVVAVFLLIGSTVLFFQGKGTGGGTIKIVSSVPMRGMSAGQGLYNGAKLAFEEVGNKAGNFDIQFIAKDDGNSLGEWQAEDEKSNALSAVKDPDVMVYMGPSDNSAAKISIPITNVNGLAQLSVTNTWPGLTQSGYAPGEPAIFYPTGKRNYFRTSPTDAIQGPAGAVWAKEMGVKNIYIVESSDAFDIGVANLFEKKAQELSLKIVAHQSITSTDSDSIEKNITDIQKLKPDLIYYAGATAGGIIPLLKGLHQKGTHPKIMASAGLFENVFLDSAGEYADGVFVTAPGVATAEKLIKENEITQRYKEKFGVDADTYALASYEAGKVIIAAIERAGKKDRAVILQEIANTQNYDGIFGKWSFDENGDTTLTSISGRVVEDNTFKFVKKLNQ